MNRGSLEIIEERLLATIPRGRAEQVRVTLVRARTGAGKDVAWHALRLWWRRLDGEWRPGKQGITIRSSELASITEALGKAAAGRRTG